MRSWLGTEASQLITGVVSHFLSWLAGRRSQEPLERMSRGYSLHDLHASRVLVELELGDRRVTVEGIAEYARGELRIPIKDPGGDFDLILHDATWNGEITKTPEGKGFLISPHREASP